MSKRPKCKTCDYTIPYHDGIDGYCFECVSHIIAASGDKFELLQSDLQAMTQELKEKDELLFAYESVRSPINPLHEKLQAMTLERDVLEVKVKTYRKGWDKTTDAGLALKAQLDALRWIPVEQGLPEKIEGLFKSKDYYVTDGKKVWVAAYNFSAYYWQCPSSEITHYMHITLPEKEKPNE